MGIEAYKLETSFENIVQSNGVFVGNFHRKSQSSFIYVFKKGTRGFVLNSLDHQILVSLSNHQDSELEYSQNFQWLLHFLLSQINVPLVNSKTDYL